MILDGPRRLLAIAGGLVGGQAGEGVVALLGEEGVVGVGVDDGAGGGAVDELALVREVGLPDGGVGREDALGAGGGRHEDGSVEHVTVDGSVVEENAGFPVNGAECAGGAVEIHGIRVGEVHGGLGGLVAKYRCGSGTGGVGLLFREWLGADEGGHRAVGNGQKAAIAQRADVGAGRTEEEGCFEETVSLTAGRRQRVQGGGW